MNRYKVIPTSVYELESGTNDATEHLEYVIVDKLNWAFDQFGDESTPYYSMIAQAGSMETAEDIRDAGGAIDTSELSMLYMTVTSGGVILSERTAVGLMSGKGILNIIKGSRVNVINIEDTRTKFERYIKRKGDPAFFGTINSITYTDGPVDFTKHLKVDIEVASHWRNICIGMIDFILGINVSVAPATNIDTIHVQVPATVPLTHQHIFQDIVLK